jgi:hypothetical protein
MPLILTNAKGTVRLDKQPFPNEAALQQYIYEHPEALPLDELDVEGSLSVLAREFRTASGPIDALATDRHANAYLIETKLFKNPDKRLVVAQVLDYAAALSEASLSSDAILAALRADAEKRGVLPPLQRLAAFLNQDEEAARGHLESLSSALAAGQVTAIVLMDRLDERLKTLIAFLNERSDFRLLAAELDYYSHDGIQIVSPHLYGAEVRRSPAGGSERRGSWHEAQFFARLAERSAPATVEAVRALYEFTRSRGDTGWGSGTGNPSFNPYVLRGIQKAPITVRSDGTIKLKFSWLRNDPVAQPFIETALAALSQAGLPVDNARERDLYWSPEVWTSRVAAIVAAFDEGLKAMHGV